MAEKMKSIISASRRTDLPAFYYDWLQSVLDKGQAEVANPRFTHKTYWVDLRPENVHSLVLWSKDFQNVVKNPACLDNYHLYFQYSINNYSRVLEPKVPGYRETLQVLGQMLAKYRPEQFNIRFDPVIISTAGETSISSDFAGLTRLKRFAELCRDLAVLGMHGCRLTTSYIALYKHVAKRLQERDIDLRHPEGSMLSAFFAKMVEIAEKHGFRLYSCSSPLLENVPGLEKGGCIDGRLLESLFGGRVSKAKDSGQRVACGCTRSTDIGGYRQKCGFDCLYCYAN